MTSQPITQFVPYSDELAFAMQAVSQARRAASVWMQRRLTEQVKPSHCLYHEFELLQRRVTRRFAKIDADDVNGFSPEVARRVFWLTGQRLRTLKKSTEAA